MHTESASSSAVMVALERHYEELVEYVRRRFASRGFAREVIHDVCVELMEKPPEEPVRVPLSLLRRMSSNRAIDRARADDSRGALFESTPELPDVLGHLEDGAYALEFKQHLIQLVQIVEALPPRARQVFLLNRIHRMQQQEIADALGISRNMVTQHLSRAMRSIETEWEPARALVRERMR
ncbi:sigma-70 family RNA polymerase sigma factor [Ottowia thiooxydans]|uniref:sigma-70 family RNA polymerase sigma factor n=1 Tax=Ottowia thiooxydans TaxID=219182 RepID=UPI0003FA02CE|nr:sigma-70 family RNA polymerase sigma factor [Ottowia thiooxydans]